VANPWHSSHYSIYTYKWSNVSEGVTARKLAGYNNYVENNVYFSEWPAHDEGG